MKKIIPFIALCVFAIGLTGCGGESETKPETKESAPAPTDEDSDKVSVPRVN